MDGIQFYGGSTPKKSHVAMSSGDPVLTKSPRTPTRQVQRPKHTRCRTPKSLGRLGDGQKERAGMRTFVNEQKPQLMARYPFLPSDQIHKKVVRLWEKMTTEQKESYVTVTSVCTPRKLRLPWTPVRTPGMNWRSKLPGGKKPKFFKSLADQEEISSNHGSAPVGGHVKDSAVHPTKLAVGQGKSGVICGPKRADDDSGHDTDTDDSLSAYPLPPGAVGAGGDMPGENIAESEQGEQHSLSGEKMTFPSSLTDRSYQPADRWTFVRTRLPQIVGQVEDNEAGILVRDGKDKKRRTRSVSFSEKTQVVIRTDSESETLTQESKSPLTSKISIGMIGANKDVDPCQSSPTPLLCQTRSRAAKSKKLPLSRSPAHKKVTSLPRKSTKKKASHSNDVPEKTIPTEVKGGVFDFDSDSGPETDLSGSVLTLNRKQKEIPGYMKAGESASSPASEMVIRANHVKLSVVTSPILSRQSERSTRSESFPVIPEDYSATVETNSENTPALDSDKKTSTKKKRHSNISKVKSEATQMRRSPRLSGMFENLKKESGTLGKRPKANISVMTKDESDNVPVDEKVKQTTILHYFKGADTKNKKDSLDDNQKNQVQQKVAKAYSKTSKKMAESSSDIHKKDDLQERKTEKPVTLKPMKSTNNHDEDMFRTPLAPARKISEIVRQPFQTPGGTTILTRSQKKKMSSDLSQITPAMSPALLKLTMKKASVAPKKRKRTNSAGVIIDVDEMSPPKPDVFVGDRRSRKWLEGDMGEVDASDSVEISDLPDESDEEFTLAPPFSPKKRKMHNVGGNIVKDATIVEEKEMERQSRKDLEGDLQLSRYEIIDEIALSREPVEDTETGKETVAVETPPKAPHKRRRCNSAGHIIDLEKGDLISEGTRHETRKSQKALKDDLDMVQEVRSRSGSINHHNKPPRKRKASVNDALENKAKKTCERKTKYHVEDVIQQVIGYDKGDVVSDDSQEVEMDQPLSKADNGNKPPSQAGNFERKPKKRRFTKKSRSRTKKVDNITDEAQATPEAIEQTGENKSLCHVHEEIAPNLMNIRTSSNPIYSSQEDDNDDALLIHRNYDDLQIEEDENMRAVNHVDKEIDQPKMNESFSSTEENEQGLIHRSDEDSYQGNKENFSTEEKCETEIDNVSLSVKTRRSEKKTFTDLQLNIGSDSEKMTMPEKLPSYTEGDSNDEVAPDIDLESNQEEIREHDVVSETQESEPHVAVHANVVIIHKDAFLDDTQDDETRVDTDEKQLTQRTNRKHRAAEKAEPCGLDSFQMFEPRYSDEQAALLKTVPKDLNIFSSGGIFSPYQDFEDEVSSPEIFLTQQSAKSANSLQRTVELLQKIGSPYACDQAESPLPSADSISTDLSGVDQLSSKSSSESPGVDYTSSTSEQETVPILKDKKQDIKTNITTKYSKRKSRSTARKEVQHADPVDEGTKDANDNVNLDGLDSSHTMRRISQGANRRTYMKRTSTKSYMDTTSFDAACMSTSGSSEKDVLCNMFDEMTTRSTGKTNERRLMASNVQETASNFGGMFQDDGIFM